MSNKIDRRSFLKVLGITGAACAMTALTGCDEEGTPSFPAGDGSVSLSSLKPFNGSVPWNGRWLPEDPFGNVYTRGANYAIFTYGSGWGNTRESWPDLNTVVEYYVDQKYRKLTMKLNPYKDTDSLSWGLVKVYVDDKLTATSDVIKQKTDKAIEFNVDITGAKYINIEPYVRESADYLGGVRYSTGGIILWDVKLWK